MDLGTKKNIIFFMNKLLRLKVFTSKSSYFLKFSAKMFTVFFSVLILFTFLFNQIAFSQTTKTVGSGGNYSTLKLAFDAINAGSITGAITLQIISSTTETSSAVLNESGSGSANYTSVNIYPTGSGYTISGSLNTHLIDFSGADNVTIDGRVNSSGSAKDLTIVNTNTGTSATTVRFVNSASGNVIKYCNIKGSETNTSRGIIFISTSTSGNGNDNNTIDNNNITNNGGNRVVNAIFSLGTSGRNNSGNVISNNNIYDVWRTSSSSYCVNFSTYSSECTITGNSFYETSNFVPTGSNTYNPIKCNYTSGVGFVVSDNFIGGQASQCGGSPLYVNSSTAHLFQGIAMNVGTSTASSVQNNTIKNFNFTASSTSIWIGIWVSAGAVNVGTTTGNTIGSNSGNGSISVTGNVTATVVQGITFSGSGTVNVQNNTIGSITTNNSNSAYAVNIYAISRGNTGTSVISNNQINNILASSSSTGYDQSVFGIRNTTGGNTTINNNTISNLTNSTTNTTSGTLGLVNGVLSNYGITTITNNTIHDLTNSNGNTASSSAASVTGIAVASTNALNTFSGNTVYNLSNTYTSFSGAVIGIYFGSTGMYTSVSHTVTENFIHSLSITGASASSGNIYGIKVNTGQTTYGNNIIFLGGNTANNIYGFYEYGTTSNNNSLYFNTIYINGSLASGITNKSYALFSAVSSNVRNFRNNIFVNARSTVSGSNLHYAAYFNYSANTNLTLNYNDYYVTGTGGVLGYYAGSNKTSLPIVTGQDANSLNTNPIFNNPGSTSSDGYNPNASLPGITGTIITTDFEGISRGATPKMGAFESISNTFTWQGNTSEDYGTASNWVGGVVPPDGVSIVIAVAPAHNCVLDQNRTIHDFTNAQSTYNLNLNGHQLNITGNISQSNGAKINASASSSTIAFSGNSAQTIPSGTFLNNTVGGLTLNNSLGLTLYEDLTVNQTLTLTNGAFTLGANTLTLNGLVSTSSGSLNGSSSTNIVVGGTLDVTSIPSVIVNNLTLNRSNGITLGGNVNVNGTLTLTSGTLSVGANTLTIAGSSPVRTSGNIDASNSNANIIFSNSNPITLPSSVFTGNVNNLTINGDGGITASSDISVNGILNLESENPSASKGCFDMGSYTLNMGANAVTIGAGDVEGIVKREHTFNVETLYTFGSQYTTFNFCDANTKPTWIICKITLGSAPGWSGWNPNGKVSRYYNVAVSNNSSTSVASINMRYLVTELDASYNDESKLVFWHKYVNFNGGNPHEHGKSTQDFVNHTIGVTGLIFGMAATTNPDESEVAIAYPISVKNEWKGEVSGHQTEWGQTQNWTAGRVPISTDDVLIPAGKSYYPVLTEDASANSIEIDHGASLTANSYNIRIYGSGGAWINNGTFDPGTGKVFFNHGVLADIVTVSGITNFYNIECGENTTMQPVSGCTLRIAGNGTAFASSVVDFSTINNTVEYNGAAQTIVNPNGINGNSGYYNLIFSGSGVKTMPVSNMTINGKLTIAGTATVTAASSLTIKGDFVINETSSFNTGTFTHTVSGNIENNSVFTSQSGQTTTLNGTSAQWIGGTNSINFNNLTVNNANDVTVFSNIGINNALSLVRGNLYVGGERADKFIKRNSRNKQNNESSLKTNSKNTKGQSDYGLTEDYYLTISGNVTLSDGYKINALSPNSTVEFAGSNQQSIPNGIFVDNKINNLKINNTAGVVMECDITVDGQLTLSSGLLNTGSNTLTFGINASDPVETSSSRIVGTAQILAEPLSTGSFSFLSCYIGAGTDDLGHISIVRKTGTAGIVTVNGNSSIQCYWDITSDNPPSNGRNVEYRWLSDLDNGKTFSEVNKAINYYSTDNGTTWYVHGDPVNVAVSNPRVMSYTTNHFSKWVSSDQNSPLPVTLSNLNSAVNGRNVKLTWITSSELNNKEFIIERADAKINNQEFKIIGKVNGKGTLNTTTNYSFEDKFLNSGKYVYRLKQVDFNGNFDYHNFNGAVEVGIPTKYALSQNFPNPFNPTTKINYELPFDSKVLMILYDITGREVKTILSEEKSAGYYTVLFDGSGISSGTYFYRIIAKSNGNEFVAAKKMVLVK